MNQKVYVLTTYYEFEGYTEPGAVFSTREGAEQAIEKIKKWYHHNDIDMFYTMPSIIELTLDKEEDLK